MPTLLAAPHGHLWSYLTPDQCLAQRRLRASAGISRGLPKAPLSAWGNPAVWARGAITGRGPPLDRTSRITCFSQRHATEQVGNRKQG